MGRMSYKDTFTYVKDFSFNPWAVVLKQLPPAARLKIEETLRSADGDVATELVLSNTKLTRMHLKQLTYCNR